MSSQPLDKRRCLSLSELQRSENDDDLLPFDDPALADPEAIVTFHHSMYLEAFENIIEAVVDGGEGFLFTEEEMTVFAVYRSLDDDARLLFIRLFMRKSTSARWFRLAKLNYPQIRDLVAACGALCDLDVRFAENEGAMTTLDEAFEMMSLDELKEIARVFCGEIEKISGKNRARLVEAMKRSVNEQSTLQTDSKQRTLSFNGYANRHKRELSLIKAILAKTGPCIRLAAAVVTLFRRLHLVFYRSTEHTDHAMTTSILARISKRNFPAYTVRRTTDVWRSRDELVEYEEALRCKRELEEMVEGLGWREVRGPLVKAKGKEEQEERLKRAWVVCEGVLERWKELVGKAEKEEERLYYLRRFEAGWVYTHILEHATRVLTRLHYYDREADLLRALLAQRVYRLGKRGAWYDRLALVLGVHGKDRTSKKEALKVCTEALVDREVHSTYMNSIQRRIVRLESELKIPRREQHDFSYLLGLKKAEERTVYGERLSDLVTGQKSVWRDDDGAECSVERVALGFYEKMGYKGFHWENGIATTLFGLLFWDILFQPYPGAFETSYQTAPLDLATDSFYFTRCYEINRRLCDISNGEFGEILKTVDERERERRTWCVGVSWDYEKQDLSEVAECIDGPALAQICRVFAEEYEHWCGGFPDLCCWDYKNKKCKFVEGPGDKLSETQKVWIDLLLSAGVDVEVCHVKVWTADDTLIRICGTGARMNI
ncbi:hypothetical protein BC937DRAFT_88121 [Endogone sp. FLAS-F59071]|nr:hypothetical protein BC937DRAFT_88121 [Endogone sp. FLAS-F59071]|eukprot:RUS18970.1 hypothetical protein BC937DRAFT_88121 [Endogone sp. FLAS-F59071]